MELASELEVFVRDFMQARGMHYAVTYAIQGFEFAQERFLVRNHFVREPRHEQGPMFVNDFAEMNEGSEFVRFGLVFSLFPRLAATNPILYCRTFPEESLGSYHATPFPY